MKIGREEIGEKEEGRIICNRGKERRKGKGMFKEGEEGERKRGRWQE